MEQVIATVKENPKAVYIGSAAVSAFALWKFATSRKRKPLGYQQPNGTAPTHKKGHIIDRDSYKSHKIPQDIDVIVVGSGMGGLVTAGLLAKVGKKVLVLEQHYVAGGCTHVFDDKGYEFDTGIHYVGETKSTRYILGLIADKPTEWVSLGNEENGHVYDEIILDDRQSFGMRKGKENFMNDLIKRFPDEADGIRKYFAEVQIAAQSFRPFAALKIAPIWLAKLIAPFIGKYWSYAKRSVADVVYKLVKNKDLRMILCSQCGDYGLPPAQAPFVLHASLVAHYLNGGYYPVGGTGHFAASLIPTIEKTGGRVLVRAPVAQILVDEQTNSAVGVKMENGDIIPAKVVISNAGVYNTFNKLLPPTVATKCNYSSFIGDIGQSIGHVYLFVGINGNSKDLKLPAKNLWCLTGEDLDDAWATARKAPLEGEHMVFISFPSAKDPTWESRYPGKSTCVIICEAKFEWFEQWKDQPCGKRDQEYEEFKGKFAERGVQKLLKMFPQLEGKIEYTNIGSPLSNNFYLGAAKGESYGLAHPMSRFLDYQKLRPSTPVNGLYMTGQDIITVGFAGAVASGLLTTYAVLGYGSLSSVAMKRDFISELKNI